MANSNKSSFNYVCAHDMRIENPLHVRLSQMWDEVGQQTNGALNVSVVPWGGVGPS